MPATVVSVGEPATAQPRQFSAQDIPHDRMRMTIAENMVRAVSEAPHVTAVFEADFSAIAAHKAAMAAKGTKLSYTAYIVKAAAEAMAVAPAINGRWEKDRIAISPTIDIGVGTALGEKGLVVPVVKDAGACRSSRSARSSTSSPAAPAKGSSTGRTCPGGSFTISNHGVSGSLLAAPIILHQGQAAILGVGKLEKRVIVREVDGQDAILVRPMAYVTLTIDHRVVDGHQTNAWLTRFVRNPRKLAASALRTGARARSGMSDEAQFRPPRADRPRPDRALLPRLAAPDTAADAVRRDRRRHGLPRLRGPDLQVDAAADRDRDRAVDHRSFSARDRPRSRCSALMSSQQVQRCARRCRRRGDAEARIGDIGLGEQIKQLVAEHHAPGRQQLLGLRPDRFCRSAAASPTCWS